MLGKFGQTTQKILRDTRHGEKVSHTILQPSCYSFKKKLAIKHTYENSLEKGLAWGRVLGFSLELHPFLGPPTPTTLPPHLVSAQGCRKDRALS